MVLSAWSSASMKRLQCLMSGLSEIATMRVMVADMVVSSRVVLIPVAGCLTLRLSAVALISQVGLRATCRLGDSAVRASKKLETPDGLVLEVFDS